jgi:hypothetical protein
MANELGLRNVSFEVGDLQAAIDAVAADGYGLVAGIGEYQNSVRMAYVRGPDGIIVSLFEQIGRRAGRTAHGTDRGGSSRVDTSPWPTHLVE